MKKKSINGIETMPQFKKLHKQKGLHFFDTGALHFFQSNIGKVLYHWTARFSLFITSEQYSGITERRYSIRIADKKTGGVETIQKFQHYKDYQSAFYALCKIIKVRFSFEYLGYRCPAWNSRVKRYKELQNRIRILTNRDLNLMKKLIKEHNKNNKKRILEMILSIENQILHNKKQLSLGDIEEFSEYDNFMIEKSLCI